MVPTIHLGDGAHLARPHKARSQAAHRLDHVFNSVYSVIATRQAMQVALPEEPKGLGAPDAPEDAAALLQCT